MNVRPAAPAAAAPPGPGPYAPTARRLDVRGLAAFLVVALGAGWLVALPLWLDPRHLAAPWATAVAAAMMATPALGALVAGLLLGRRRGRARDRARAFATATGIGFGPVPRRTVAYFLLGWFGTPLLAGLALLVATAFGWYHPDPHLSAFRAATAGASHRGLSPGLLLALQLASTPLAAVLPNGVLAFGEELGWRGFLLPRLLPLGQWPAILLTGLVWGLWHAPLLLLGYEYPRHTGIGVALMCVFTILTGVLFGWLRLASGSVWPSTIAHGALNTTGGLLLAFGTLGARPDPALAGVAGVSGWLVLAAVIVVLVATGRFPVRTAASPAPSPASSRPTT